jgi:YgiT-type zinc finger domain-containing protein
MSDIVDRCEWCSGELKPGKTTLQVWRGGDLVVIRDVPADVCQQCQEAYISANVSVQLDRFMVEYYRHRPERYLAVPQYSAAQLLECPIMPTVNIA